MSKKFQSEPQNLPIEETQVSNTILEAKRDRSIKKKFFKKK
jgi:hypothetical protein